MDRFIQLVRKKLGANHSKAEEEELKQLLDSDDDLKIIYRAFMFDDKYDLDNDILEAEKAYTVHLVKMQLKGLLE